jgi:hypothetical protein
MKFLSGVERLPKSLLKKQAERRANLNTRLQSSSDFIDGISPFLNSVPTDQQKALQKQYEALKDELEYLNDHFKTSTQEFDRRLEVLLLNARTFKVQVACISALSQSQYDAEHKKNIQEILDGVKQLTSETYLHYEDATSEMMIEYRRDLQNLETKIRAQLFGQIKFTDIPR